MKYPIRPETEAKYKRIYDIWYKGASDDELSKRFNMTKQSIRTALWKYREKNNLQLVRKKSYKGV